MMLPSPWLSVTVSGPTKGADDVELADHHVVADGGGVLAERAELDRTLAVGGAALDLAEGAVLGAKLALGGLPRERLVERAGRP